MLVATPALADIVIGDTRGCRNKAVGAGCTRDDGSAGVCRQVGNLLMCGEAATARSAVPSWPRREMLGTTAVGLLGAWAVARLLRSKKQSISTT